MIGTIEIETKTPKVLDTLLPAPPAEPKTLLEWESDADTTTANSRHGDPPGIYVIILESGRFKLIADEDDGLESHFNFDTLDDAKAEAERIERDLLAANKGSDSIATPGAYAPEPATLDMLRDHDRTMRELAHRIAAVKAQWIDAKELAADYKKRLDGLYEDLAEMAREQLGFGPLFDSNPTEPQGVDAPVDPNAWRSVAIDALGDHGVSDKHLAKLHDADITTLGKLADMSASGLSWFKDVKGIGEAAADKIQLAAQAWHLANMLKPVSEPEAETNDEWWIKPVEALEAHGTTPDDSAHLRAGGFTSTEAMIDSADWTEFGAGRAQSARIEQAMRAFYVAPNDRTITDTIDDVSPL